VPLKSMFQNRHGGLSKEEILEDLQALSSSFDCSFSTALRIVDDSPSPLSESLNEKLVAARKRFNVEDLSFTALGSKLRNLSLEQVEEELKQQDNLESTIATPILDELITSYCSAFVETSLWLDAVFQKLPEINQEVKRMHRAVDEGLKAAEVLSSLIQPSQIQ